MSNKVASGNHTVESAGELKYVASQWKLMWWRFLKHRMAVFSAVVVLLFYLIVPAADFLAYANPEASEAYRALIPPQKIHLFDEGHFKPYVFALDSKRDLVTFRRVYEINPEEKLYLSFFTSGYSYKFLGFIPSDLHFIGIQDASAEEHLFLFGTDDLGRDFWSRMMVGTRTSLTVGLVGVLISVILGVSLGGISGYYGGVIDLVIQRIIEILQSIPTIPLWMGLAAALPHEWSVVMVYFAITIIISLIGWTGIARVVRGQMLSLRKQDNIMAAELIGCSTFRIISKHMLPVTFSYIIAAASLEVPRMIVSETALSFLGLGLRPPAISWGVLLHSAQNVHIVATAPWLLLTVIPVMLVVLGFNFIGDGLRDAADPY
jgi:peptide/nickel transport system permease protein